MQPAVEELLAASAQAQDYWLQAVQAETRDDLINAAADAANHDGSEPASTIRELLGLGSYDEGDYT